jgi:hypothetical protein
MNNSISLKPIIPHTGIRITDKDQIQMYVYGGKGRFRLKSLASGKELTYKISPMSKHNKNYDEYTFYVSLVIAGGTSFMGVMKSEENKYIHSKRSNLSYDGSEVKGIRWLLSQFEKDDEFDSRMEFYHMGICSCCGKTLTTPVSVEMGIGPVCFQRYGNKRLKKLLHLKKKIEQKMTRKSKTLVNS